jgi:hypothetical protein
MKKQLFIFLFSSISAVSTVDALQNVVRQTAHTASHQYKNMTRSTIQTHIEQSKKTQSHIRKALYLKCTLGAALCVTAVGLGYSCVKNKTPLYSASGYSSSGSSNGTVARPAPQVVYTPAAQRDYYGLAKLVGLCGSVFGLFKSFGSVWCDFTHFFSIKEDIQVSLKQQEEMQLQQNVMHETLNHVDAALQKRDEVDEKRWQENQQNHQEHETKAQDRHMQLQQQIAKSQQLLEALQDEQQELAKNNSQESAERFAKLDKKINKLFKMIIKLMKQVVNTQQPGSTRH